MVPTQRDVGRPIVGATRSISEAQAPGLPGQADGGGDPLDPGGDRERPRRSPGASRPRGERGAGSGSSTARAAGSLRGCSATAPDAAAIRPIGRIAARSAANPRPSPRPPRRRRGRPRARRPRRVAGASRHARDRSRPEGPLGLDAESDRSAIRAPTHSRPALAQLDRSWPLGNSNPMPATRLTSRKRKAIDPLLRSPRPRIDRPPASRTGSPDVKPIDEAKRAFSGLGDWVIQRKRSRHGDLPDGASGRSGEGFALSGRGKSVG